VREKAHLLRYSDPYVVNRHNEFGHESVWRYENFQLFSGLSLDKLVYYAETIASIATVL
jgi:hypothetical protein